MFDYTDYITCRLYLYVNTPLEVVDVFCWIRTTGALKPLPEG